MSIEQNIENLEIRNANVVTFVGSSSTIVDTISGRIQCKGFQHNSNVITDISGPHGRIAPTLKKYPEIAFDASKADVFGNSNAYAQAGYEISSTSRYETGVAIDANDIKFAFDGRGDENGSVATPSTLYPHYASQSSSYSTSNPFAYTLFTNNVTDKDGVNYSGEEIKLKLPNKIKLSKLNIVSFSNSGDRQARNGHIFGSNTGANGSWTKIIDFTNLNSVGGSSVGTKSVSVSTVEYFEWYSLVITHLADSGGLLNLRELEYYGYEEDPPAGDHSVDTTFKSRFNNPQLTGVQVFVDGKGSGSNQIAGGPTVTDVATTYNEPGKYWELTGELTSNIAVEANTFLEGDQPHSVSMWFNSSNLEANVSNTCVFSVSDQEKLDSVNLDLQSNTWHNLTYAYQGEGGSKVTYLDGRKVAEDQAEDTFGVYPPFAMTGYSQGGYVVSASSELNTTYLAWKAYDNTTGLSESWISADRYNSDGTPKASSFITIVDGIDKPGEYLQLELPHNMHLSSLGLNGIRSNDGNRYPRDAVVAASRDGNIWTSIGSWSGEVNRAESDIKHYILNSTKSFKYIRVIVSKLQTSNDTLAMLSNLSFYGHRENDLVRLPDPTNVLKYPHIAMTGPAQRGYALEVSSSHQSTSFAGYQAELKGYLFDDDSTTYWHCNTNGTSDHHYNGNNSSYGTNSVANFDPTGINVKGEWIQLEFPHKLKISKVHLLARSGQEAQAPEDFAFYGSDTGSAGSWTLIQAFTGESPQDDGSSYYDITSNPAPYKYILMLMTRLVSSTGAVSLAGLRYYGTGVDSVPIQIGGGNIDKVANFRVYDKFIGEDQALEIWNAQKEEFGRAKPQMVLQQGKLGIGTDAPQGSLSVADEPDPTTYGLQEFPPRAMTDYETYMEGHGVFKASESSIYGSDLKGWKVFDGDEESSTLGRWTAGGNTSTIGSLTGKWVKLELPYRVNFSKIGIFPPSYSGGSAQCPTGFSIIVSNDNETWTSIKTLSNYTWKESTYNYITFENDGYFKYIAVVATTDGGNSYTSFQELRYFGYREQVIKQSVLHDGQLTLTKNLTVPSIGPSVTDTRHTVPKRHNLVVEFDTSTNPTDLTKVRDTSGMGNDAVLYGHAYYSTADKAFKFDGTSDTVYVDRNGTPTDTNLPTGDAIYTISCWIKHTGTPTSGINPAVFFFGSGWTSNQLAGLFLRDGNKLGHDIGSTHVATTNVVINRNQWHHVVVVKRGTGTIAATTAYQGIFVDGVEITQLTRHGGDRTQALGSIDNISIGSDFNGAPGSFGTGFNGCVSKPQIWSVALTAGDVKALYDIGRGDSYHVTNFKNTLVGINLGNGHAPRSALDVRDLIYARTTVIGTFTGQHICFPDESMEKGLIVSAKKNRFVKLNGFATGREAITIDESLPIVSLSNVAQDKACFGVVSKMEETHTEYRTEITGGLVSESVKITGDNRAIVNSVGEGAIWVVDTGGALESGDYITTSNVAGYGQKQDGAGLMNYTVAKITMDCDFTGSNVAVQTIKREETGTRTITEDTWNQLVDYDRSSNTETQYSNTLAPSAYSGQSGYVPREVTTIVDYMDGSNIVSIAEWSNLESNIQNTYQSNTFTEIVDYTKFVNLSEWSNLTTDVQNTFSEAEITTYYQIQRGGNVLDENGQLQFEDKTGATEAPYERRFLDASGAQTDEANAVHIAAFVGCTYHCG